MYMEPREYAFHEGALYVAVYQAELQTEGAWRAEKVRTKPALIVSSHPEFRYRDEIGTVKIRGRFYRVHTGRTQVPPFERRDGRTTSWTAHGGLSYHQYMNDNNLPVNWDTATARRLDQMVDEACDRYAVDVPDWHYRSVRLAVAQLHERALDIERRLHEELTQVTERRNRFAAALELPVIKGSDISPRDLDRR